MDLFNTNSFIPRAMCGNWTPLLIALYIVPNAIIALTYWWIPLNGLLFWKKSGSAFAKSQRILFLYAGFIFWCGISHIFDIIVFKWPLYYLNVLVLNIAAIISLKAGYETRSFLSYVSKLPSPEDFYKMIDGYTASKMLLEIAVRDKDALIEMQKRDINRLKEMIETQSWIHDRGKVLTELTQILERMRK